MHFDFGSAVPCTFIRRTYIHQEDVDPKCFFDHEDGVLKQRRRKSRRRCGCERFFQRLTDVYKNTCIMCSIRHGRCHSRARLVCRCRAMPDSTSLDARTATNPKNRQPSEQRYPLYLNVCGESRGAPVLAGKQYAIRHWSPTY